MIFQKIAQPGPGTVQAGLHGAHRITRNGMNFFEFIALNIV